jgi:hypothetical protein
MTAYYIKEESPVTFVIFIAVITGRSSAQMIDQKPTNTERQNRPKK